LEQITVFLSDWQVLFREGIHFTLSGEEDLVVVGETTSNKDALEFIKGNPPRIAVVNIDHGELSGPGLARCTCQNLPGVCVILVLETADEDQLYSALKCGAAACITKDIDPEELVGIIRQVAGGSEPICQTILRPDIAVRILKDFDNFDELNKEIDNLLANLTSREIEILRFISGGKTIEEITAALNLTGEAVDECLGTIWKKLVSNEHSRDVVEAAQKGLSSIIDRTRRGRHSDYDYISRDEFEAFRKSLKEHFRSFTD
jgi:DNA-binding NarL/FixJ family response regulator